MWFCPQQADESLDFEEQILEAAKSIAAATSALVKSASAAQRELVAQGKVSQPSAAQPVGFYMFLMMFGNKPAVLVLFISCLLQVGSNLANAVDDGQWSQGLISAVSCSEDIANALVTVNKYIQVNIRAETTSETLFLAAGSYGCSSYQ